MIGIYINCKKYPFCDLILSGDKTAESRTRNVFKSLFAAYPAARAVHLIETGNGEPVIVGRAIMHRGHFVGPDMKIAFDVRNKQACINGTDFYNPGGKWFYCFERVEAVDRTPLNTFVVKNHGRSFCEFHVMNFED